MRSPVEVRFSRVLIWDFPKFPTIPQNWVVDYLNIRFYLFWVVIERDIYTGVLVFFRRIF